jgi:hypothetical protein
MLMCKDDMERMIEEGKKEGDFDAFDDDAVEDEAVHDQDEVCFQSPIHSQRSIKQSHR